MWGFVPCSLAPEHLQGSETQTAPQRLETFFSKTTCQQQEFVAAHFEQYTPSLPQTAKMDAFKGFQKSLTYEYLQIEGYGRFEGQQRN